MLNIVKVTDSWTLCRQAWKKGKSVTQSQERTVEVDRVSPGNVACGRCFRKYVQNSFILSALYKYVSLQFIFPHTWKEI